MGLLELPWLVQEELLKALDVVSLFMLSFASKKTKKLIQSVRFGECKANIFVDGKPNHFEIKLLSLFPTDFALIFKSKSSFSTKDTGDINLKKEPKLALDIDGCTLKVRRIDCSNQETIFWLNGKYLKSMYSVLVKYLCNLFNEKVHGVELHKVKKHLIADGIRDMKFGDIRDYNNHNEIIKAKNLDKFLRRVPAKDCLTITYKLRGRFPSDSPFYRVLDLLVNDGKEITRTDLLLFEGENAFICRANIDFSDVLQFLKHWMSGKSRNLETMIVSTRDALIVDKDELRKRFGARRWNPKQRAQNFVYSLYDHVRSAIGKLLCDKDFDCSTGFDIERVDGRLATIKFTKNRFFFFVWNHILTSRVEECRKTSLDAITEEDEEEEQQDNGTVISLDY
uniref:F-box domain-containing protein n=1 Tax=Caenorhabditis tropicalis TaxID=1561998 RepID=A0A1I7TZF5_9PELO